MVLAGGAEACGNGVDGEQEAGVEGFGFGFIATGDQLAPLAEEFDLLAMEDAQRGFADFEGFGHAGSAFVHGAIEQLGDEFACAFEFIGDEGDEFFAHGGVGDECGVGVHEFGIG